MGYVYDFKDAVAYEQWLHNPRNQITAELESRLMLDMLKPAHGESMLDIGCGAGASLLPFLEMGLQLTGLDPSPYMLDIAVKKLRIGRIFIADSLKIYHLKIIPLTLHASLQPWNLSKTLKKRLKKPAGLQKTGYL